MWRVVGYPLRLATSNDEQVAGEAYHVRKADEAAPRMTQRHRRSSRPHAIIASGLIGTRFQLLLDPSRHASEPRVDLAQLRQLCVHGMLPQPLVRH
jgi:hypothetical protein